MDSCCQKAVIGGDNGSMFQNYFHDSIQVYLFQKICLILENEPIFFTHRDFHSRNIMVKGAKKSRYFIIDFQDARLGPLHYDLVSLLRDSYYPLSNEQVDHLSA